MARFTGLQDFPHNILCIGMKKRLGAFIDNSVVLTVK